MKAAPESVVNQVVSRLKNLLNDGVMDFAARDTVEEVIRILNPPQIAPGTFVWWRVRNNTIFEPGIVGEDTELIYTTKGTYMLRANVDYQVAAHEVVKLQNTILTKEDQVTDLKNTLNGIRAYINTTLDGDTCRENLFDTLVAIKRKIVIKLKRGEE